MAPMRWLLLLSDDWMLRGSAYLRQIDRAELDDVDAGPHKAATHDSTVFGLRQVEPHHEPSAVDLTLEFDGLVVGDPAGKRVREVSCTFGLTLAERTSKFSGGAVGALL